MASNSSLQLDTLVIIINFSSLLILFGFYKLLYNIDNEKVIQLQWTSITISYDYQYQYQYEYLTDILHKNITFPAFTIIETEVNQLPLLDQRVKC